MNNLREIFYFKQSFIYFTWPGCSLSLSVALLSTTVSMDPNSSGVVEPASLPASRPASMMEGPQYDVTGGRGRNGKPVATGQAGAQGRPVAGSSCKIKTKHYFDTLL